VRRLAATLRHQPGPLAGTLAALTVSAVMVSATASLIGTGATTHLPAQRLTAAPVVVAGGTSVHTTAGHGQGASRESQTLPGYRRLPASLAARIAAVPGVTKVVTDVSVPLTLVLPGARLDSGTAASPLAGHGWASAALTPFRLTAGTAPRAGNSLVVGSALARADRLRPGGQVRLAGLSLPPFTVTGIATAPGSAARDSVFFTAARAAALYGHPGQADLIGVFGSRAVSPAALATRIRGVLPRGDTVATGSGRGALADLAAAGDGAQLTGLGTGAGIDIALISLFVVAGAVALSVGLRRRQYALLRAVGATGGQVRRSVLGEQAVLGLAAGLIGFLPGEWLAGLMVTAMARHDLMPSPAHTWRSPWLLLVAVGAGVIVAELSGWVAAWRAGRSRPADALRESVTERRWPNPVRTVAGLAALGGGITLMQFTLRSHGGSQLNEAFPLLLVFMAAVALLGPLLVAAAEIVLRWPARWLGRASGRLAVAEMAARPRRTASAVIPAALAVAMVGTVYFAYATIDHDAVVQGRQRLAASQAIAGPPSGLSPAALAAVRSERGVRDAVGLASTSVTVTDPDLDPIAGEVVSSGAIGSVLDLAVSSGRLAQLRPGEVAVSSLEAGSQAMNTRVGRTITVWLADGTPYRAWVSAIYSRSLGFGDVLIPAAVAAGHDGTAGYGEILVHASGRVRPAVLTARLAGLERRFPGVSVASRSVANAQAQRLDSQSTFLNNLMLALIAALAAVSLVVTLVVAAAERREALRLLGRTGATRGQLAAMTGWQSVLVSLTGIVLGALAGAASLAAVARAVSGSWTPWITPRPALALAGLVLALALAAALGPTALILRGGERH